MDPDNTKLQKLMAQVPMSRRTTERGISAISKNVKSGLMHDLKNCTAFSLALDESTDIQDITQLTFFVSYL